jgi:hypothetical protein
MRMQRPTCLSVKTLEPQQMEPVTVAGMLTFTHFRLSEIETVVSSTDIITYVQ